MKPFRILVCGGRDYEDFLKVEEVLSDYIDYDPIIISGGATGADRLAKAFAHMYYLRYIEFPANWPKYNKAAGAIRNQQMIDQGKPHLVIAFPGGNGTADMVRRAKKHNIEVIEIDT